VTPVTPTVTTSATVTVPLGSAIDDTASLLGTANEPGTGGAGDGSIGNPTLTLGNVATGSITFSLYGPFAANVTPTCSTAIATRVVNVSGDGHYLASSGTGSGSLTPSAVGVYEWIAVYGGDSPNTLGASTTCRDTGEASTVTDTTSTSTAQNWLPNDTATITSAGGSPINGTVTFTLYNNGTCTAGTNNANVLYKEGPISVSGASGTQVSTNNTSVTVTFVGTTTVSWEVVYSSGNTNISGSNSNCETTTLTITN